jgi:hypothetical protein
MFRKISATPCGRQMKSSLNSMIRHSKMAQCFDGFRVALGLSKLA